MGSGPTLANRRLTDTPNGIVRAESQRVQRIPARTRWRWSSGRWPRKALGLPKLLDISIFQKIKEGVMVRWFAHAAVGWSRVLARDPLCSNQPFRRARIR